MNIETQLTPSGGDHAAVVRLTFARADEDRCVPGGSGAEEVLELSRLVPAKRWTEQVIPLREDLWAVKFGGKPN